MWRQNVSAAQPVRPKVGQVDDDDVVVDGITVSAQAVYHRSVAGAAQNGLTTVMKVPMP
jgi:hypothetical protein